MNSIASKQVEGTTVMVKMVNATKPGIRVSNITAPNMCDEECLQIYFSSSKMSGGGKVESVEILSKTEAIITFSDPAGIHANLWYTLPLHFCAFPYCRALFCCVL